MVENKLDVSNNTEKFETVCVELDDDSIKFIERYIILHPELGYATVEQYLEGLFQINVNRILTEVKNKKIEEAIANIKIIEEKEKLIK